MVKVQSLDIAVVHGKWSSLINALIMIKSISKYSHCVVLRNEKGKIYDPTIGGILKKNLLTDYSDRNITLIRYNEPFDVDKVMTWCDSKYKTAKGYDYSAWLGFATGIKAFEDEDRWFCSEVPYWMFEENGYKLFNEQFKFPYPSDLMRCPKFDIIAVGKVKDIITI